MSLNKNNLILFFSFTLFTAVLAQEQQTDSLKNENLDEIVITATRTKKKISLVPLPVSIVTKADIKNINSIRLTDILREQVGLVIVPDFGGGNGVQMQGLDSQYVLILIDGFPIIGRSAGTLDLNRVSLGNIKRVEIVKGASSSLYGSSALGGVINTITEMPTYGFKMNFDNRFSSFGTYDNSISLSTKRDKLGFSFFVNRYSTEGFDLDDDPTFQTVDAFKAYTFNSKVTYDFNEGTNLYITARYYNQKANAIYSSFEKGDNFVNEYSLGTRLTYQFSSKNKGVFELYGSKYSVDEEIFNVNDGGLVFETQLDQTLIRPEYRGVFSFDNKSELIVGLGLTHETIDRDDFFESPIFNAPFAFLQYYFKPIQNLGIIIGARYDAHNEYKSQLSPKFGTNFQLSDKITLKGSVGTGYKAPDFRQLYFDFTNSAAGAGYTVLGYNVVTTVVPQMIEDGIVAPEGIRVPLSEYEGALQSESSLNVNLGGTIKFTSKFEATLNLFRNDVGNLIDTRVVANKTNGQNIFSYYNVREFYSKGIEFNTSYTITNNLKLSAGYQFLIAKDKEAESAFKNGDVFAKLPGSPTFRLKEEDYFGIYNRSKHTANFKLFYRLEALDLNTNLRAIYRSKYGLFDTNANGYLDVYDEFVAGNILFNYAINKDFRHFRIGVGIDNIFNYKDINITNNPGRSFYASINFEL